MLPTVCQHCICQLVWRHIVANLGQTTNHHDKWDKNKTKPWTRARTETLLGWGVQIHHLILPCDWQLSEVTLVRSSVWGDNRWHYHLTTVCGCIAKMAHSQTQAFIRGWSRSLGLKFPAFFPRDKSPFLILYSQHVKEKNRHRIVMRAKPTGSKALKKLSRKENSLIGLLK